MKYNIFISYRREGGFDTAKHLSDLLSRDGYKVSFDIDTLRNGKFDTQLLTRIEECNDFILIVDSNAFQRTFDPEFPPENDWLRRELAHALKHHKNIIPVFLSGVKGFPDNLPEDISPVTRMNGPEYNKYYFDEFYKSLKKRFLKSWSRKLKIKVAAAFSLAVFLFTIIFTPQIYRNDIYFTDPLIPQTTTVEQLIDFADNTIKKATDPNIDSVTQWKLWSTQAKEGIAESQFHAALCCLTGYGCQTNNKLAFKYMKQAAMQGYAPAKYGLSVCYDRGIGTSPNINKAQKLAHEAAQEEILEAQSDYGIYCSANNDIPNSIYWLQKSAEQGYAPAQYNLGWAYSSTNNFNLAFEWMTLAAANNYSLAKVGLSNAYLWGYEQYRNLEKGVALLKELTANGNTYAQYQLAKCYINGYGVDYNYELAKELTYKAAEKNFAPALTELGILHSTGNNETPQDTKKALEYFLKAAEQGYPMAQYYIGQIYANGWGGIKQSYIKANRWFRKANMQGINHQTVNQSMQQQQTLMYSNQ